MLFEPSPSSASCFLQPCYAKRNRNTTYKLYEKFRVIILHFDSMQGERKLVEYTRYKGALPTVSGRIVAPQRMRSGKEILKN